MSLWRSRMHKPVFDAKKKKIILQSRSRKPHEPVDHISAVNQFHDPSQLLGRRASPKRQQKEEREVLVPACCCNCMNSSSRQAYTNYKTMLLKTSSCNPENK